MFLSRTNDYQLFQIDKNYCHFRDHLCPHHQGLTLMGTETVPEMSVIFNQLTWLIARGNFINIKISLYVADIHFHYICA